LTVGVLRVEVMGFGFGVGVGYGVRGVGFFEKKTSHDRAVWGRGGGGVRV